MYAKNKLVFILCLLLLLYHTKDKFTQSTCTSNSTLFERINKVAKLKSYFKNISTPPTHTLEKKEKMSKIELNESHGAWDNFRLPLSRDALVVIIYIKCIYIYIYTHTHTHKNMLERHIT